MTSLESELRLAVQSCPYLQLFITDGAATTTIQITHTPPPIATDGATESMTDFKTLLQTSLNEIKATILAQIGQQPNKVLHQKLAVIVNTLSNAVDKRVVEQVEGAGEGGLRDPPSEEDIGVAL